MAEVSRAPVNRLVMNEGEERTSENVINALESLHSPENVPYHITFPFEWRQGDILIAKIEKLSEDELREMVEKNNGTKGNPTCAICGEQKKLDYRKESGNVSHLICEDCAIRYVRKARELGSKELN
jgi:hypothetical protein